MTKQQITEITCDSCGYSSTENEYQFTECSYCNCDLCDDCIHSDDYDSYCEDCFEDFQMCEWCDSYKEEEMTQTYEMGSVCDSCMLDFIECNNCKQIYHMDDIHFRGRDDEHELCFDCSEQYDEDKESLEDVS